MEVVILIIGILIAIWIASNLGTYTPGGWGILGDFIP